jgi:hypothetical protein
VIRSSPDRPEVKLVKVLVENKTQALEAMIAADPQMVR